MRHIKTSLSTNFTNQCGRMFISEFMQMLRRHYINLRLTFVDELDLKFVDSIFNSLQEILHIPAISNQLVALKFSYCSKCQIKFMIQDVNLTFVSRPCERCPIHHQRRG